jgi:hypothetical protein
LPLSKTKKPKDNKMPKNPELEMIQADINEALAAVCEKHGISIQNGTATKCDLVTNLRFKMIENREDGTPRTEFEADLETAGSDLGFTKDDLGRPFYIKNKLYRLAGTSARCKVRPVAAVREDGAIRKFSVTDVQGALTELEDIAND